VLPSFRELRPLSPGRRPGRARLGVEQLESRSLPSAAANGVLGPADLVLPVQWQQSRGQPATARAQVAGAIGTGPSLSADVAWYTFTLDRAAQVTLTSGSTAGTVLSLYNTDTTSDPYDPLGQRLLTQAQGGGGDTTALSRALGPGTYYVGVSGTGNTYFNPFVADSGYAGAAGGFQLSFAATALGTGSGLPRVLNADVSPYAPGRAPLTGSPFEIYLNLSGPLGGAVTGGLDVELHAAGAPGGPNLLAGYAYSSAADELQLQPAAPLGPGRYTVTVSAVAAGGVPALARDYSYTFQVGGVEGVAGATAAAGTAATARPLDLSGGFAQATGAIGDNPADGFFNANDVNVYSFQITQPGNYSFIAEAFAGRIGSPLTPALSLFEVVGGQLQLVGLNAGTQNNTPASPPGPAPTPLANDPVLYAPLSVTTPGQYYLVVSEAGNQPDPFAGPTPFDPNAPFAQSFGGFGLTTGPYVLNVSLQRDNTPAQVVSVTPLASGSPQDPPASFTVTFSKPVNLQQLLFQTGGNQLGAVTIVGPGGQQYQPVLESYNPATYQATFVMLDRLPPGSYTLHLSGTSAAGGITDLAGNPLVGNDLAGKTTDYVVPFTVAGSGPGGNYVEGPNSAGRPQDLGTLAPYNLQQGVSVGGAFAGEQADYYQFQVMQARTYVLTVGEPDGTPLPAGTWLTITDLTTHTAVFTLPQGNLPDPATSQVNSDGFVRVLAALSAGDTYVVTLTSWGATPYALFVSNFNSPEAPPALTVGPAPAIGPRLLGSQPPPPAEEPPPPAGRADSSPGESPGGAVQLVSFKEDGTLPAGPGAVPGTLSAVPDGVLLSLSIGPLGGPAPGGVRPGPDVFNQVFAQGPPVALLGTDAPGPDGQPDTSWLWKPPAGGGAVQPTGTGLNLWQWLSEQLGPLYPLGPGGAGPLQGAKAPADRPQAPPTSSGPEDETAGPGAGALILDEPGGGAGSEAACALFAVLAGVLAEESDRRFSSSPLAGNLY
jgi:hypothetical protein